ncbi:hypothetical protein [Herbaspirillum sp. B65]|uniref:hypothetical protein n=1 Tax=Herbaspirillum sp. B65 TaxID=137708 RepID=UPI0011D1BC5C|nr:hypothetical protein [Herbaspirillum sp. B65]
MTTAYTASNPVAMASLPTTNGIIQRFTVNVTNTSDATYAPDGLAAAPIYGLGGQALQGNEMVANSIATLVSYVGPLLNSGSLCWILFECIAGAQQVAPATASQHAVQFGQVAGVVGQSRNARISIPTASSSATFTVDELIVETALGGLRYCLSNLNQSINLTTSGVGGMDTGSAPNNGTVAVYEMYNPTSGAKGLIGFNATSVTPGQVYGGSNAPAGYTASSLVAILQTNGSGQFKPAYVSGRKVSHGSFSVLNTSNAAPDGTSLDISSVTPKGAIAVSGYLVTSNTTSSDATNTLSIAVDSAMNGAKILQPKLTSANGWSQAFAFDSLSLSAAQTIYYGASASAGSPTYKITLSGYEF